MTRNASRAIVTVPEGVGPDGIASEWILVTPEQAREWLTHNTHNRNLRAVKMSQYEHDMQDEHWVTTHQGIAFCREGRLLDGQHRLHAIVESDHPQWMLVTTGLDPEAQKFMDRGATRSPSDFMNGRNAPLRVAAIRLALAIRLCDYEITSPALQEARRVVTDADIYQFVEDEPGFSEDIADLAPIAARAAKETPLAASGLLAIASLYPRIAEDVMGKMFSGAEMGQGHPVLALRNYRAVKKFSSGDISAVVAARIFNAIREGRTMGKLQVQSATAPVRVPRR